MARLLSKVSLLTSAKLLQSLCRQERSALAACTGRLCAAHNSHAGPTTGTRAMHMLAGFPTLNPNPKPSLDKALKGRPEGSHWQGGEPLGRRGMANRNSKPSGTKRLTVKTTTKSHRFSHYIKADREEELRRFWKQTRGCTNPAFLQRYINFSRIYARFRDMNYLPHTMVEWDAAINRLFDHDKGKQPANNLVRKHPYLLNVKIIPLQFAKNAVKGKLPLYDWRLVLRDLRLFVGEDVVGMGLERKAAHADADGSSKPGEAHFSTAKRRPAGGGGDVGVAGQYDKELDWGGANLGSLTSPTGKGEGREVVAER